MCPVRGEGPSGVERCDKCSGEASRLQAFILHLCFEQIVVFTHDLFVVSAEDVLGRRGGLLLGIPFVHVEVFL